MLTGKLVAGGIINCSSYGEGKDKKTPYYFTQFGFTLDPEDVKALGLSAESLGTCLKELEEMGDFDEVRQKLHHRDNQGWQNYGLEIKCPGNPLITVSLTPESNAVDSYNKYHILASFFMRTETGESEIPEREVAKEEIPVKEIEVKESVNDVPEFDEILEGKVKELTIDSEVSLSDIDDFLKADCAAGKAINESTELAESLDSYGLPILNK